MRLRVVESLVPSIETQHVHAKVAVLGTGSAGMRHLEALRALGGVWAVAIPMRPERSAVLKAAGYPVATGWDEAVRQGVQYAVISTDTGRHVQDGLKAVERGLDVLVEKPIAVDAREARRLCDEASKLGRTVYVGCVLRFSDSLNTFRRLLKEVGSLHTVHIECQSYLPDWRPDRPYQETYAARPEEGGGLTGPNS